MSELTTLRDQLKAGLSATVHNPSQAVGPSVLELADRIKALKAGNTIDTTPQRPRQNHATAEEPITARIRRRTEASPAFILARATDAASETGAGQPPEPMQDSLDQPMTIQERILRERQRNGQDVCFGSGA